MSVLAKKLREQGHRLENPIEVRNKIRVQKGLPELEDSNPVAETDKRVSFDRSEQQENISSESEEEEEEMKTPKKTIRETLSSPSHVMMGGNSPGAPTFSGQDLNPVSFPMMAGFWEDIDFNNNMQKKGQVVIRMIIHNGISNTKDVEAEWKSSTVLKIRLRWPDWFSGVLQMMEFQTQNINGGIVPVYGRSHPLTLSFGKHVYDRLDENNEVWDEGFFSFDRPMNEDSNILEVEILDVKVGAKEVKLLQITAQEARKADDAKKPKAIVTTRAVKTGSSAGKNYPNVRNRDDLENEMSDGEDHGVENREGRSSSKLQKSITSITNKAANLFRPQVFEEGPIERSSDHDSASRHSSMDYDPDLWLLSMSDTSSFHSVNDSIESYDIDPLRTFEEAHQHLEDLATFLAARQESG